MSKRYGILGQASPAAATFAAAYTAPGGRHATVRVLVCNRGSAAVFRVALSPSGTTLATAHYVAYDQLLADNDSASSVAFTVAENDVVRVWSASGEMSFTVTGIEDAND